MSVHMSVNKDG